MRKFWLLVIQIDLLYCLLHPMMIVCCGNCFVLVLFCGIVEECSLLTTEESFFMMFVLMVLFLNSLTTM